MIGKGKSISHTKASIQYGWNEEKDAKIVHKQLLMNSNPNDITKEFKFIQQFNPNCKKNTLSFVLSPTIEDGKKIGIKELRKITKDFILLMNIEERQAIAFVHQDKDHKHIHLYVNRIDFHGNAYNDSFIGKKAQKVAEKVAILNGLKTVKQVQKEKENSTKVIRKEIFNLHNNCIKQYKPKTFQEYIQWMKQFQIEIKPVISKANQLQGFKYTYQKQEFKGSAVHRELSINKIALQIYNKNKFLKEYQFNKGIEIEKTTVILNKALLNSIQKNINNHLSKQI